MATTNTWEDIWYSGWGSDASDNGDAPVYPPPDTPPPTEPTPEELSQVATDRLYARLPEHYRTIDELLGRPLYWWIAGIGAELGRVEDLITRLDYRSINDGQDELSTTSALTDPTVADVAWLPWLAQLVGVTLYPEMSTDEKRDAIRYASSGWRAGTKRAIADAAKTTLTGTKFAQVYDHSVFDPGDGGQWDVLIITRGTETADDQLVLESVIRRGAKPAGVVLHTRSYSASWDQIVATYPTWTLIEQAGSWNKLQEAGLDAGTGAAAGGLVYGSGQITSSGAAAARLNRQARASGVLTSSGGASTDIQFLSTEAGDQLTTESGDTLTA